MKASNKLIYKFLLGLVVLGGLSVNAADTQDKQLTEEHEENVNDLINTEEEKEKEIPQSSSSSDVKSILVTIKNRSSYVVRVAEVSELKSLLGGLIPPSMRLGSILCQRASCALAGTTITIDKGQDAEMSLNPAMMLSIYVVDFGRTIDNGKKTLDMVSKVPQACKELCSGEFAKAAGDAADIKGTWDKTKGFGGRFSCDLETGTTIVLLNPKTLEQNDKDDTQDEFEDGKILLENTSIIVKGFASQSN